jgi:hypothetical protein
MVERLERILSLRPAVVVEGLIFSMRETKKPKLCSTKNRFLLLFMGFICGGCSYAASLRAGEGGYHPGHA